LSRKSYENEPNNEKIIELQCLKFIKRGAKRSALEALIHEEKLAKRTFTYKDALNILVLKKTS